MSATLPSGEAKFRSLTSQRERWIGATILGGIAALIAFGGRLSPSVQALVAFALALLLVVSLRKSWVHLVGPVLVYDLVRTARHSRTFLLRCVYAAALLAVMCLLYSEKFSNPYGGVWKALMDDHRVPPSEMARFAELFFTRFLAVQLAMVFLLTPAYTASAIAEEKERKTLDFLLATDLRSREIVLGKLASRLAHLVLFVVAGLPVLVLMQFLGGVDPNLVLAGFVGTALTMLSLASLGILISAYSERPRRAIVVAYLLSSFFMMCSYPMPGLTSGNPFAAWQELMEAAERGALAAQAPAILRRYAVVHGLIAGLCCLWASIRLRWWSQPRSSREPEMIVVRVNTLEGPKLVWRHVLPELPHRPRVSDAALLWKEQYVEALWYRRSGVRSFFVFLMFLGSMIAGLSFIAVLSAWTSSGRDDAPLLSNLWVRGIGTSLACLLLIGVALRAAAAFSRERERRTWDSLLTTPLDAREMFWAKAWGSIQSTRWGWWFLAVVWLLGMFTLGLHPLVVPLLALAWFVHAAMFAGAGLWFSLVSRTTMRATVYTLLVVAGLSIGPPLLAGLTESFWIGSPLDAPSWIGKLCYFGISPPSNLWSLATYAGDFKNVRNPVEPAQELVAAFGGVVILAAVALALWQLVWFRFLRAAGRTGVRESFRRPLVEPVRVHADIDDATADNHR
jgi:ABC-type transport system involved in multi-copper enzyme maturation permease subunit